MGLDAQQYIFMEHDAQQYGWLALWLVLKA